MKPKPHPSEEADVVVFLDANMPNVRDCSFGCGDNPDRMCVHRFGPRIWVCRRPKGVTTPGTAPGKETPYNRLKDLEVSEYWISQIRKRWADRRGIVQKKRFVLATHDVDFLKDANLQDAERTRRGGRAMGYPLRFGETSVHSGHGKRKVSLKVFVVQGNLPDRYYDLKIVLEYCRRLQKDAGRPL